LGSVSRSRAAGAIATPALASRRVRRPRFEQRRDGAGVAVRFRPTRDFGDRRGCALVVIGE
jgi:hypothetical protein